MMSGSIDPPSRSQADDELYAIDRAWFFTKEYSSIPASALFSAISKSAQEVAVFKVWKVDDSERYMELTTHSIKLSPGAKNHQVQADIKVLEGKNPSSSVLNIRIMPTLIGVHSLYEIFTNVDVDRKFAEHVANLIFRTIEGI